MRFQRLEDLRIDADKTQEEIANILDCKREVYRRYEKGEMCIRDRYTRRESRSNSVSAKTFSQRAESAL